MTKLPLARRGNPANVRFRPPLMQAANKKGRFRSVVETISPYTLLNHLSWPILSRSWARPFGPTGALPATGDACSARVNVANDQGLCPDPELAKTSIYDCEELAAVLVQTNRGRKRRTALNFEPSLTEKPWCFERHSVLGSLKTEALKTDWQAEIASMFGFGGMMHSRRDRVAKRNLIRPPAAFR